MNPWNSPFKGLAFFLTHPALWGWALLGTFLSALLTFYACFKAIAWTYPSSAEKWAPYVWHLFQSFGWGFFALVLMVAIVFPLIFNACFAKGLAKHIGTIGEGNGLKAFTSSFWVFFRTLRWRILWPVLLLICIFIFPIFVFPLSLLAANHLAVIEAADLILSLYGWDAKKRVHWLKSQGTECFAAALSGALLSVLLSLTVVGWLLWIPAIYCGVFLWTKNFVDQPLGG